MNFMNLLVEDLDRIFEISEDGTSIREVLVLSSVLNPVSLCLSYGNEYWEPQDLADDLTRVVSSLMNDLKHKNLVIDSDFIAKWAVDCLTRVNDEKYEVADILESVDVMNEEARSTIFYPDAGAIQIVASPTADDGKTMAIAFSADDTIDAIIKALKEKFGEFVMVIYPLDLSIGSYDSGSLQFFFHLYNDKTESATVGTIFQGDICGKCGEFFSIFPGQIKFCCKI